MDHQGSSAAGSTTKLKLPSAVARSVWRRLVVHPVALMVVISALLSHSGGEPVLAGCSTSLFVVIYLFAISCSFSAPATTLAMIFVALSYVALAAYAAGSLVSRVLGMALMYMDSILAAGFFGGILADHMEMKGLDLTALVACTRASVHLLRKYRRKKHNNMGAAYFFLLLMAIFCSLHLASTVVLDVGLDAALKATHVAMTLFGGLAFILFLHTICVLGWLNGAVFGDDHTTPVILWYATMVALFLAAFALFGDFAATNVLWLCILASAAFLGYFLEIHDSYDYMMVMREQAKATTIEDCAAATTTEGEDKALPVELF